MLPEPPPECESNCKVHMTLQAHGEHNATYELLDGIPLLHWYLPVLENSHLTTTEHDNETTIWVCLRKEH